MAIPRNGQPSQIGVINIYLNSWFYKEFVLLSYFYFYEEIFFFCRYREKTQHGKWFFVLFCKRAIWFEALMCFRLHRVSHQKAFLGTEEGQTVFIVST